METEKNQHFIGIGKRMKRNERNAQKIHTWNGRLDYTERSRAHTHSARYAVHTTHVSERIESFSFDMKMVQQFPSLSLTEY